jgi:predicted DNA-binding transcriptional regulator YafY
MASAKSARPQLARLLQLLLLLGTKRYPTANELAECCEVSRRTVYRDLETLALAGVLVAYRPEHQGYELVSPIGMAPSGLDEREAAALLVLASSSDDGLGLRRSASTGVAKLLGGLPLDARERLRNLGEAISGWPRPSAPPPGRPEIGEAILEAVARRRQLRIWYLDPGRGEGTTRVAPYRLVRAAGSWSLIGRSSAHGQVWTFPLPAILKAQVIDVASTVPPRFDPGRNLDCEAMDREPTTGDEPRGDRADPLPPSPAAIL